MKKYQKTPSWIVSKRARKAAKRVGNKTCRAHATTQRRITK